MIDVTELDDVAVVTVDDGKANALSFELIAALIEILEKRAATSKAIVLAGRPGMFSAGLDLAVVRGGDKERFDALLDACTGLYAAMLRSPVPIVAACTGHAVAGGALLLLCCDYRFGLRGAYKIGFGEMAIGLPLPRFGSSVARARLSRRHFIRATVLAEMVEPDEAVDFGFLDSVVETDVVAWAAARAETLVPLTGRAYVVGKHIAYRGIDVP